MATVRKRGKKWYAIYKDEHEDWKERSRFTDKGQTQKLAQKLEDEALARATGMADPDAARRAEASRTSLTDHVAAWEQHMIVAGISQGYIAYATRDVKLFATFSGAKTVAEIIREDVDQWVIPLFDGGKEGVHVDVEDGAHGLFSCQVNGGPISHFAFGSIQENLNGI